MSNKAAAGSSSEAPIMEGRDENSPPRAVQGSDDTTPAPRRRSQRSTPPSRTSVASQQGPPSDGPSSQPAGGSVGVLGIPPAGMQAIPVGGDVGAAGGGVAVGVAVAVGEAVIQNPASRKRGRDAGAREVPVANPVQNVAERLFQCRQCHRQFTTDKGLFGHMRVHSDRQWKGALPPPSFTREEFADAAAAGLLNPTGQANNDDEGEGDGQQQEAPIPEGQVQNNPPPPVAQEEQPEAKARFFTPDLNLPPPENDDQ